MLPTISRCLVQSALFTATLPKTIITRAPSVWLPWCGDDLTQVTYHPHYIYCNWETICGGESCAMGHCECVCARMWIEYQSFDFSHISVNHQIDASPRTHASPQDSARMPLYYHWPVHLSLWNKLDIRGEPTKHNDVTGLESAYDGPQHHFHIMSCKWLMVKYAM